MMLTTDPIRRRQILGQGALLAFGLAVLTINIRSTYAALNRVEVERNPGLVMTSRNLIAPAQWLNEHLPDEAVIASRRIGALGYFSNRRIFDFKFGLIHRDVARLITREGRRVEYPHDPALAALWTVAAPTHILEDREIIDQVIRETHGVPDAFVVHGFAYRVVRGFPIGESIEWTLCERTADEPQTTSCRTAGGRYR